MIGYGRWYGNAIPVMGGNNSWHCFTHIIRIYHGAIACHRSWERLFVGAWTDVGDLSGDQADT